MKRFYLVLTLLFVLSAGMYAQPAHDDCPDAIELTDLDMFCEDYVVGDATYDVVNGNCVTPPNLANIWYTFTAQSPQVNIAVGIPGGIDAFISLGAFDDAPCDPNGWKGIECDLNDLSFDGLIPGQDYYVIISFDASDPMTRMRFCIDNPDRNPPPNDDPCDAITITPNGQCLSGTTIDASPDWAGTCPPEYFENSVYYQTTISAGNNTLTADLNGLAEGAVLILDFQGDCNSQPLLLAQACGASPLEAVAAVEGGKTYWILVSTSDAQAGPFTVCATESGPPPGCSENDLCANAKDFGTIIYDQPKECLDGCNIGGTSDGVSYGNCLPGDWITNYFSFRTDANASRATITIDSDDPNVGSISAVIMQGCGAGSYISCQQGTNGSVSIDGAMVQPNTTYIIIVGTPPGATGEFDVCIQTFRPPDEYCVARDYTNDSSLARLSVTSTSMGSPLYGPYVPGEEVSFEYYIPSYNATTSIQWLQGIVPVFGTGWDPSSFDAQGMPLIHSGPNSHGATWSWYPDGGVNYRGTAIYYTIYTDDLGHLAICYYTDPDCPNTGITAGEGLPAGWFAARPGGPCTFNGHPSTGYGDGLSGPWTVTFTLKTRPYTGPESCTETGYVDCSVKMFTFGDEQTGCWFGANDPNACAGDEYKGIKALNKCCEGPEVDPYEETICSGDQTSIDLTSNLDPDVSYSWTVSSPSSVTGASPGSGKFIAQRLINTGNSPQTVTYTVTGRYIPNSCEGDPIDIFVTVLPEIIAEAGDPIDGCAQVDFVLGGSPTASGGDGGPYTYKWNNGADPIANPSVRVNSTTTFVVTVTDENGCSSTDAVTIEVMEAVLFDIEGETEFCDAESSTLSINPISGDTPYTSYEWEGPGGYSASGQEIEVYNEGVYEVTVTDGNGCSGTSEVLINVIQLPEIIMWAEADSICPEQQIQVGMYALTDPEEGLGYTVSWDTPSGPIDNVENLMADEPGTYIVYVTDDFGCASSDSLILEPAKVPEPVIVGDSLICPGNVAYLSTVRDDYFFYNWSDGSVTQEIAVTEAGEYSVTVTTSSGCTGEASFIVEVDETVIADAGEDREITCDSLVIYLDGSHSSTGEDYEYNWSTTDGNILSGADTHSAEVDAAGTYTLTVTNIISGCVVSDEVLVLLNTDKPPADAGFEATLDCDNTQVTIGSDNNPTGAQYEILWTTSDGNIIGDFTRQFIDVNAPGEYIITVRNTENGCENRDTVTVHVDQELPTAIAGADFILDCDNPQYTPDTEGTSIGSDYTYSWSSPDGGNIVDGGSSLNPTFDAAGTYVLEVTNISSGCVATDTLEVQSNIYIPVLSGPQAYEINCYYPDTTIFVIIDNYDGNYIFTWNTTDGNIVSGQNDSLAVVDASGIYVVVVTNLENKCQETYEITVSEDFTSPTADAGSAMEFDCVTTELTLDGTGSSYGSQYTYEWTGNPGNIVSGADTRTPVIDEPGTYTIVVTNNDNGCSSSAQVIITQTDDIPIVDGGGNREITCDSTTIRLLGSASGGVDFSYEWTASNGGNIVSGGTTLTPIVDAPGTYELKVIDNGNGCSATATILVLDKTALPEITEAREYFLTCEEPQITMDAEEGTATSPEMEYEWSTVAGNIIGATDGLVITADAPGIYTFVVTNTETGCSNSVDFEVILFQDEPDVEILGLDTLTCERDMIILDARNSSIGTDYEGTWTATNGGEVSGDESAYTLEVTKAGTYTFEVVNTANGCKSSVTVTVEENKNEPIIEEIEEVVVTCADPEIMINAVVSTIGEADYTWSSTTDNIVGATDGAAVTVNGEGTLTLRVIDLENSCSSFIEVSVIEDKEAPRADAGESMTLTCEANTVTLDGTGSSSGSEYTYSWSSPDGGNIVSGGNTLTPVVDVAATYILTVRNENNGCSATDEVKVNIDENLPQIYFNQVEKITCARTSVVIDASNSSSGDGYDYRWETTTGTIESENGLVVTVSKAGTYTLTIINVENNCVASANITVEEDKETPHVEIATPDVFDCLITSIIIDATNSDSGNEYEAQWTTTNGRIISGQNTLELEVGKVGIYELQITNTLNGCSSSASVEVIASDETPVADAGPDLTLTCVDTTLVIDARNSSVGTDYYVEWSTQNGNILAGDTTLNPTVNKGGDYILTVTNITNMCVAIDTMTVFVNQEYPILSFEVSNELNCTYTESTIKIKIDNAAKHRIEWYFDGRIIADEEGTTLTVDTEGIYTVIVENTVSKCYSSIDIEVPRNTNIITDVVISTIDPSCFDDYGCVVIDSIVGGEMPYSIYIDGEFKGSSMRICGIEVGKHDFKIVDKNGCDFDLTFTLNEFPEYWVSIGESYEINKGDTVSITYETNVPKSNINSVLWDWYLPDDIPCNNCETVTVNPEQTTKIFITLTDINGCPYEDFANIIVRKDIRVYVPSAFTPNGDNLNDILTVYGDEEVKEVLLFEIYDRWGELVFKRENFQPGDESSGWDGTYRSQMMRPDVFLYKVQVLMEDGNIILLNGTTTLLK